MDHSCYITLTNNLNSSITLAGYSASHGDWDTVPPSTIAPKATSYQMRLKDNFGFYGAEGSFRFQVVSGPFYDPVTITMQFGCPFHDDNYVRTEVSNGRLFMLNYRARSGDGNWHYNSCPSGGHPLTIEYTLSYVTIRTATTVDQIKIVGDYAVQNAAGTVISYTNPIWSCTGNYIDGNYSTNPALLKVGNTKAMTVTLNVDEALRNVPFVLSGYLGKNKVASSATTIGGPGMMSIPMTLSTSTTMPSQIVGDIVWELTIVDSQQVITIAKPTRLELYWISAQPSSMYSKGVWVSVLRNVFPEIVGADNQAQIVAKVANYCFTGIYAGSPKQYDCVQGAPHYNTSWEGGFIDLKLYYSNLETYCNCYDQAGIVQASLGALGISSTWQYFDPCGFINQTNLIGWGECNNPFFKEHVIAQILPINDPNRTLFGNHAFITYANQVIDACQGPYTATKSIAQYISAAIDTGTTLYTRYRPPYNRPGTKNDVLMKRGIVSVEKLSMKALNTESPQVRVARELVDLEEMAARWGNETIVANWNDMPTELFAGQQLRDEYRRVVIGPDGAQLTWIGDFGNSRIRLEAFVSSVGQQGALEGMLTYCASISRPLEGVLTKAPAVLGPAALALPGDRAQLLWVNRNVFLRLEVAPGTASDEGLSASLIGVAQELNERIERRIVVSDAVPQPSIAQLNTTPQSPSVGDLVTIDVRPEGFLVEAEVSGPALVFESNERERWYFRATVPGDATIVFTIADPATLVTLEQSVQVYVKP